ncbi:MAG: hypothetical protein IIA83_07025 [Thaumarchaeota archaeon]|nr:hypothetical protein [Nitrososphaerota archaeon]
MTEETKPTNERQESTNSELEKLQTIFTEEEVRSTVKAFVLAYLRGTITVDFPNITEFLDEHKHGGKKYTYEEAKEKEINPKVHTMRNIDIVSGTTKSTKVELEEAIQELFTQILFFRAGHRIKGKFMEFDIEKKLDDFENRLSATNKVIEEFVNWYTETEKGYRGNLS